MSYRGNYDVPEGPDYEETDPETVDREKARKTWGGWVFAAFIVIGIVATAATGRSVVDWKLEQQLAPVLIGMVIELAFVLFAAYRVRIGKGWLIGSLACALWVFEIIAKINGGTLNIGWGIAHVASLVNFAIGVWACWNLRSETA